MDKCANCGRLIGNLETPSVWQDNIVCATCRKHLEASAAPATASVAAAIQREQGLTEAELRAEERRRLQGRVAPPPAARPAPAPAAMYSAGALVCTQCGYIGAPKKFIQGSFVIELILWLMWLLPGLIYSIWRLTTKYDGCPLCNSKNMIPANSPMAERYMRR